LNEIERRDGLLIIDEYVFVPYDSDYEEPTILTRRQ
jgi:hypothetical protein